MGAPCAAAHEPGLLRPTQHGLARSPAKVGVTDLTQPAFAWLGIEVDVTDPEAATAARVASLPPLAIGTEMVARGAAGSPADA
jgi:hypothetical protein